MKVSEALEMKIAGKQYFKCANKPGSNLIGLDKYDCPLWKSNDDKGCFDESTYEIDYIVEHSNSHNNDEGNLQALCKMCYSVKNERLSMDRNNNINKQCKEKKIINTLGIKQHKRYQCNRCKNQFGKQRNNNHNSIQIVNNGNNNENKLIINKHYHLHV